MNRTNNTLNERIGAIVRSIASGNNACGSLLSRDGQVNEVFIAASVKPTLEVYESELAQLREDRANVSQESENRRQALEYVYSNALGALPRDIADRVCKVLGFAS